MLKLMLNLQKFNNYAFFCPVSRLHLTVSSPVGYANEVTPAILKAVKSNTVIDVDGVIDLETGTVKKDKQEKKEAPKASMPTPGPSQPEGSKGPEVPDELQAKTPEQPKATGKRGGKKKEAATE